ncbi:MAG: hypothetical protein KBD01_04120 [Acidobacteria bacterium]|nr:hypothetical protein [Acidobacteriota bacterium]
MLIAAAGVAIAHTVLGPDHYLPFVMIARARRWTLARTLTVTGACGVGHVGSSVLLGLLGIAFGIAVGRIEGVESHRGTVAAWLLVGFGLAYAVWGLRHALRRAGGYELHGHGDAVHVHTHGDHAHQHEQPGGGNVTFWTLFAVFVLGPCEPLIPLFILPASRGRWGLAIATAVVFGVITVASMLVVTAAGHAGLATIRLGALERWSHSLAGVVIAASGLAVIFLGL